MKEQGSRPEKHSDRRPSFDVREVIARSVVARESSRATRLHRTLSTLLSLTRSNPPATPAAFHRLLDTVLDALIIAAEAPMGNLQLYDPATRALRIRAHRGFKPAFIAFFDKVHTGSAACGSAFAKGAPVVVEDVSTSPLFSPEARDVMIEANACAVQSLALVSESRTLGVVSVHYAKPGIPARKRDAFAFAAPLIAQLVEAATPSGNGR